MTEETLQRAAALKHERGELTKARDLLCKSGVMVGIFEQTCGDLGTYYPRLRSSEWKNLNSAMHEAAKEWLVRRLAEIDAEIKSL